MEHVMDAPGWRQFQLIRYQRDPSDDPEGSLTFWGEFHHLIGVFQVAGLKPYLIPNLKHIFGGFSLMCSFIDGCHGLRSMPEHLINVPFSLLIVGAYKLIGI
jgi:hypothetical protein